MKTGVAFITGSSSGIGQATAYAFAKAGYDMILTYHSSKQDGEQTEKECKRLGADQTLLLKLDILNDKSIKVAAQAIKKKFGKIDVLVNNAGVLVWKELRKQDNKDIELQVRTDLESLIKITLSFLSIVKKSIINISSQVGEMPFAGVSVYSAAKWGVRGFTKSLALEQPNLRVVSVNPGMTATKMTEMEGIPASEVADLILATVEGRHEVESGGDVDVWKIYNQNLPQ